jgi:NAD(P)-dependent dehydrogenase (short-subunit alcohol dehydrogenase family)
MWLLTVSGKERKIRVNALSPGPIEAPGVNNAVNKLAGSEVATKQFKTNVASAIPMCRWGSPDEIAKVAVFLASDDSSYVTAIELFIDGGMAQI